VFEIYDRILLLADYRLACVRYTLGIFPVVTFGINNLSNIPLIYRLISNSRILRDECKLLIVPFAVP
jgi:hypothetical protein